MFASVSAFFRASQASSPIHMLGRDIGVGILTSAHPASSSIGIRRIIFQSVCPIWRPKPQGDLLCGSYLHEPQPW